MIFDIETDGLLEAVTKTHCLVIKDTSTGIATRYSKATNPIEEGLKRLLSADRIIGHNVIKFDIPVIKKLYPWFDPDMSKVLDTLVMSRLIYADIGKTDSKLVKKGTLPGYLFGSHGLEAWGYRLKKHKGDYSKEMKEKGLDPWAEWCQEMEDYCVQDTEVTQTLLDKLNSKGFSPEAIELEHQVATIVARQERYGLLFDTPKAVKLYSILVQKKLEVENLAKKVFKPMYLKDGKIFTPKRDNKKEGYVAGCPHQKIKLTEFNPGSRDHISHWLKKLYQWEPTEFTPEGKPKIDDDTLVNLNYPEVAHLKEYLMLGKRCGQLSEGNQAWLKKVGKDGRMHGSVNTIGAVTRRMTHSNPNMAQVPAGYSPYGHECRELFYVPKGKKLVGADAAALELRDLAGYMANRDEGAYVNTVLKGDKKAGTDIHSINAKAIGLDPAGLYFDGESGRDIAKTWFYAFIYGAGDEKLGYILTKQNNQIEKGRASRDKFLRNLPALGDLVSKVKKTVKERDGYLKGLDGGLLSVRSQHAALNTLLQAAGAIQMKKALVILDQSLKELGYKAGTNYEFVANVHDEWQIECDEAIAETVGKTAVRAIQKAGEHFNFKCPLDGEYKVGNNWSETH